jgi:hypothetical protein
LGRAARGHDDPAAVLAAARAFSGAWPYQLTIGSLSGLDPMHPDVVRGYWVGNDVTAKLDRDRFAEVLLARLRAEAGQYWPHLSENLVAEVAPSHAFHVLGVYPWSRLLDSGRAVPLHVLESCRIGWGTVVGMGDRQVTVEARRLSYEHGRLALGPIQRREVGYRLDGEPFVAQLSVGETVALHWDFVCDRLTETDVRYLSEGLERQLDIIVNRRCVHGI